MSRHGSADPDCKVYVGDLDRDASEKEVERAFSYYGPLKSVWVARNPPGFAFVEFEDRRDADDAVRGLDGTDICGSRVRVELSNGKSRVKPWERDRGDRGDRDRGDRDRRPPRMRRAFNPSDRCFECGGRGHYAYDCTRNRRGGGSHRSRSRSRSRSYDRRDRRDYSRSRSRSRSPRRSRSRSR